MHSLRQFFSILLPLAVGIALLFALRHLPVLTKTEHALFLFPERFQKDYSDHGDRSDLSVRIYSLGITGQIALSTYQIAPETRDILGAGSSDLTPTQWAYLLSVIREKNNSILAIASPLSWPEAEEIPLRTLQHELSQLPTLAIALTAEHLGTPQALPPYLQSSLISSTPPPGLDLPQIDHISSPPSVNSNLFGIATIKGNPPEKNETSIKIPLLVRWDQNILPSFHLAALIASHKISPTEIIIDPSGYLRLGQEGSVIPIDSQGRTTQRLSSPTIPSATTLLTRTELSSRSLILLDQSSPLTATLLEQHHYTLWPQKPSLQKTYQRWSLLIEIGALLLFALLLQTRNPLLIILTLALLLGVSLAFNHWFPLIPILGSIITLFLISKKTTSPPTPKPTLQNKPKPAPVEKPPVSRKTTSPAPKKEPVKKESPPQKKAPKKAPHKTAKKDAKKSARKRGKRRKK